MADVQKKRSFAGMAVWLFVCFFFMVSGDLWAASLGGKISLSRVETSFLGEKKFDNSSSMLTAVGDVNSDGLDDFLVGAKNNDEAGDNAGTCYLVFGKKEGLGKKFALGRSDVIMLGAAANDQFGTAAAGVGDVNGDGIDDFVVASPYADGEGDNLGVVNLFFGRKNWKKTLSARKADVRFNGERDDDAAGVSVSFAGDVNGDGYHDFLIAATGNDDAGSNCGKVYLILGKKNNWDPVQRLSRADASFIGEDKGDRAGVAVAFAGDVNGDGFDDFLVGAGESSYGKPGCGQTYLLFGKASGWIRNNSLVHADASFVGEMAGDNSGFSVAAAGDVNGDSFSDILIGAPKYSGSGPKSGAVYLFLGKKTGWKLRTALSDAQWIIWGERKRDSFGISIAGIGDVSGDGLDDFVVGANKNREVKKKSGKVYLFTGVRENPPRNKKASNVAAFMLLGEKRGDYAGVTVALAGDIDGDGANEFLVGADSNSENGKSAGKGYLISYRKNTLPLDLKKLQLMTDSTFKEELTGEINRGGNLYLQMTATDPDPAVRNWGLITVSSNRTNKIRVSLLETAPDSGVFRRVVSITGYGSNRLLSRMRVSSGETIAVIPSQKPSKLISVAQQVSFDSYFIDDGHEGESSGNGNHRLEPGEKIVLKVSLKNHYFEAISGIALTLSCDDPQVKIIKNMVEYGLIERAEVLEPEVGVVLQVAAEARAGSSVHFKISMTSLEGNRWFDEFDVPIEKIVSISGVVVEKLSGTPLEGVTIETSDKNRYQTGSGGRFRIFLSADQTVLSLGLSKSGYLRKEALLKIGSREDYLIGMNRRVSLTESWSAYLGQNTRDASGYSVAGLGDVNGDGYDDVLIGAWSNDQGGIDSGKVYLMFGTAREKRSNSLAFADVAFIGERPYDEAGRTVSAAGDVNHDGFQDFLIGAPGNDQTGDKTGKTYLIFGRAAGWKKELNLSKAEVSFTGEKNHDRSGSTLSGVGDINGDGYDDFLIGAWSSDQAGIDAGQAYLILGKGGRWRKTIPLAESDGSFVAENFRDEAAKSISYAGDVNGDGYDDFLIGAPSCNQNKDFAGKVYLVFGRSRGFGWGTGLALADASFLGLNANDAAGMAVSTAGDVNGDGFDDILIGAWSNDLGGIDAGAAYLFFGKKEGWSKNILLDTADVVFVGERPYDAAGLKLSGAGDVNGDGFDDFLIGAWGSDTAGKDAGETYLILGKPAGWKSLVKLDLADFSLTGAGANDSAGRALSYAGDVNGDGNDDILIGAWSNDKGSVDAGASYVVSYVRNLAPKKIRSVKLSVSAFSSRGELDKEITPVFSPLEMAQFDDSMEKETFLELDPNKNRYLYIMLEGEDRDPSRINVAKVLISGRKNYFNNVIRLVETAPDSGIFERALKLAANSSSRRSHRIMTKGNNVMKVYSWDDGSKTARILIKDTYPPTLSDFKPKEGARRISINSDISLAVTDSAGIREDSIKMSVAGEQVSPELTPITNGYRLYYKPSESFSFNQDIKVKVMASDLSGMDNTLVGSYSFFTASRGILSNPGFEDDFAFWSVKNIKGATVSLDTGVSHKGKKSCKIFFTGQADAKFLDVVQMGVPVRPDAEYLLSCYMKSRNLTSNSGVRLYVEGSDSMGRVIDKGSFFNYQSGQLLETNDWTRIVLNFKTLSDTQAINIYVIRWDNGEVIKGTCWVDDFYLAEETEAGFTSNKVKGWFTNFLME